MARQPKDPSAPRKPRAKKAKPTKVVISDMLMTLEQARKILMFERFSQPGIECPVCLKHAKVYARYLGASGLWLLVRLYWLQHDPTNISYAKVGKKGVIPSPPGGDYAKMRWWGLIEPQPDQVRADGSKRAGFWRITNLGRQFVEGSVKVRRCLYEYNSWVLAEDPANADKGLVDIYEAQEGFDLSKTVTELRDLVAKAGQKRSPLSLVPPERETE